MAIPATSSVTRLLPMDLNSKGTHLPKEVRRRARRVGKPRARLTNSPGSSSDLFRKVRPLTIQVHGEESGHAARRRNGHDRGGRGVCAAEPRRLYPRGL